MDNGYEIHVFIYTWIETNVLENIREVGFTSSFVDFDVQVNRNNSETVLYIRGQNMRILFSFILVESYIPCVLDAVVVKILSALEVLIFPSQWARLYESQCRF